MRDTALAVAPRRALLAFTMKSQSAARQLISPIVARPLRVVRLPLVAVNAELGPPRSAGFNTCQQSQGPFIEMHAAACTRGCDALRTSLQLSAFNS